MQTDYYRKFSLEAENSKSDFRRTFYSPLKLATPIQISSVKEQKKSHLKRNSEINFSFSKPIPKLDLSDPEIEKTDRIGEKSHIFKVNSKQETSKNSPVRLEDLESEDLSEKLQILKTKPIKRKIRGGSLDFSVNFNEKLKISNKKVKNFTISKKSEKNSEKSSLKDSSKTPDPEKFEFFTEILEKLNHVIASQERNERQEIFNLYDFLLQAKTEFSKIQINSPNPKNISKKTVNHLESTKPHSLHFFPSKPPCQVFPMIPLPQLTTVTINPISLIPSLPNKELQKLTEDLSSSILKSKDLETSIMNLQHSQEKLHSDYSILQTNHKSSQVCIKNLQDSISLLREENLLIDTQLKNSKILIETLSAKYAKSMSKSLKQKEYIESLVKIIKDFQKQEYGKKDPELETEKNKDLLDDLEIVKNECRRLSEKNKEILIENEKVKKNFKELQNLVERNEKEKNCLKEDLRISNLSLNEVKSENLRISQVNEKLKEEYSKMRIDCLAYKDTLKEFEEQVSRLSP
jgi:hypothetical protein